MLALSVHVSLAGFTAGITNNANTAGTGTLVMTETGIGGVAYLGTCTSPDATCVANKFGGQTTMLVGATASGTAPTGTIPTDGDAHQNIGIVRIMNTGTVDASALSLAGSTCTSAPVSPALCAKFDVAVYKTATAPTSGTQTTYGTQVFYGTGTTLATANLSLGTVAPGGSLYLTFVVWVDGTADNTYQGATASEPLTWTFVQ